jgi:hypothetical protein
MVTISGGGMTSKLITRLGVATTLLLVISLPPASRADAITWDRASLEAVFGPSIADYLLDLAAGDSGLDYGACPECKGTFAVTQRYDGTNRHFLFMRLGGYYVIDISVPSAFGDEKVNVPTINLPGIYLPGVTTKLLSGEFDPPSPPPPPAIPVIAPPPVIPPPVPVPEVLPPVIVPPTVPDISTDPPATPAPIPEPTMLVMLGSGFGLLGLLAWRRRRS